MEQIGVLLLIAPTVFLNGIELSMNLRDTGGLVGILRYSLLALVNGMAFTSYNLASTYILSRISVVHHASLNCLRRVFAIISTSMIFGNPITTMQMAGIALACAGFLSYIRCKQLKDGRERRRYDMRRRWGGIMRDVHRGKSMRKASSEVSINGSGH